MMFAFQKRKFFIKKKKMEGHRPYRFYGVLKNSFRSSTFGFIMPLIRIEKTSSTIMISPIYAAYLFLISSVNRFATLISFAVKQSMMSYSPWRMHAV